jgi:pre-mRNA-splicing factor SYF2
LERGEPEQPAGGSGKSDVAPEQADGDDDSGRQEDADADDSYPQMTEKQKKLFQLQLKMVQYNHLAILCPSFSECNWHVC